MFNMKTYMKAYRIRNKEKAAKSHAEWYRNGGKKMVKEAVKKYRITEKQRVAYNKVKTAIRNGTLKVKQCLYCGKLKKMEAHHEDYSKPLDFVWLCHWCHRKHHAIRKEANE